LTEAAHGCLEPSPTRRLRRVHLHLSYSMTISRLLDTTSRRTGRELLSSSGSHQANTPVIPISQCTKRSFRSAASRCKNWARPDLMDFKALELSHRPGHKRLIDISQQGVERRGGITPIVRNPPPRERIELLGNVLQGQLCLTSYLQVPNRLPDGPHRRGADCWIESSKQ